MDFVKYSVNSRKAYISWNRPPVNALNTQVYKEIVEVFQDINQRADIGVVVLSGEGRGFCGGTDMQDILGQKRHNHNFYQSVLSNSVAAVYQCRYPVIAAVHNFALGAGLAYAAACDFIIATAGAKFGIPEVKISIVGASGFANAVASNQLARYMAYTGNPLTAEHLYTLGSVLRVTENETSLWDEVDSVAEEILANSSPTVQLFKTVLNLSQDQRFAEKFLMEYTINNQLLDSYDREESIKAFLEKRAPNLKHEF